MNSDQWIFQQIQVEDGLQDSTVFSIQQDKNGFMWFGTTNGLSRFDGYEFKSFVHDGADVNTISNNNAGNIYVDSSNNLWIGTFGGGLNSIDLNSGVLTRFPYSSSKINEMVSENVQTFFEDSNSNLWVGTPTGLYKLKDKKITHFAHEENNNNSLIHSRIWNIVEDDKGSIWLGTSNGLSELNTKNNVISNYQLPEELNINISSNQMRKLLILDNTLWIGSSSGIYEFDLITKKFSVHSNNNDIKINDIFLMDGNLLIASMNGLYYFDVDKKMYTIANDGQLWQYFKHIDIRDIVEDKSGLLWLASRNNGVFKLDTEGGVFTHNTEYIPENQESEMSKQIWSLEFDLEGNLFIGTSETLYKSLENNEFERIVSKGLDQIPGTIYDLETAQDQGMWIATGEGLFYLEKNKKEAIEIQKPFDLVGINSTGVFSMVESPSGEIWLALYNTGILHWNPNKNEATLIRDLNGVSLSDLNISKIYQDQQENLWIGSNIIGVLKYNPRKQSIKLFNHIYNNEKSLSSNRVEDIYQDSNGRIWIATARGLNLFNSTDETFNVYNQNDGLLDKPVKVILEDSNKNLWIVFKSGVSRINSTLDEINNYVINSGIRNDGINNRASIIDKDNKLYLGSSHGYYTLIQNDMKEKVTYQPSLILTNFRKNNVESSFREIVSSNYQFNLNPSDQEISFDFAALEYKSPDQVQYSYKVSGLQEIWFDVSSSRHVTLKNLNPGKYVLEIKATNNDGRWKVKTISLDIIVHPVWYNIGWVRLLFLIFGVTLALLVHNYRTTKIRNQNLKLESEVKNRTTELMTLNKQLKSASQTDFLTGLLNRKGFISHYKNKHDKPQKCSIVILDIDKFKDVNDIYGHSVGDAVLKEVAEIMLSMIQENDLIARWGGEEFIIYLEDKNSSEAYEVIEDIRKKIQNTTIEYNDKSISVTSTFGICQMHEGMRLKECINDADEAMYQGKAEGRNQTCISEFIG